MEPTGIIQKPLITEKWTFASDVHNRYAFQVDMRATKTQIKQAIETLYGVKVVGVATQNCPGKLRRMRYGYVRSTPTKRAIIKVREGDRIEFF